MVRTISNTWRSRSPGWGALIALLVLACGGTGGGRNPPDPRPCGFNGSVNLGAAYANNQFTLIEPRKCPYTVPTVGAMTPLHATFDALGSYVTGGTALHVVIRDKNGTIRYDDYPGAYIQNTPGNPLRRRAEANIMYTGGYGTAPLRDSAAMFFDVVGYGVGEMYALFPGNVNSNSSDVVLGTDTPMSGASTTWRAYPQADTVSYLYQWQLDGYDIPGASTASYTWIPASSDVGPHTLSVRMQMSNLVPYTRSRSIYVVGNCGGSPCF